MPRRQLGVLLVETGAITQEQLEEALKTIQRSPGTRLGEYLVRTGICTENQVAEALALQFGIPFLSVAEEIDLDPDVSRAISEEHARRKKVVPLRFQGNHVVVAMVDPLDVFTLDEISFVTGKPVEPIVVPSDVLNALVDRAHGKAPPPDEPQWNGKPRIVPRTRPDERMQAVLPLPTITTGELPGDTGIDQTAIRFVDEMIAAAVARDASDIHVEPLENEMRVRYRVDGVLHQVLTLPLKQYPAIMSRIKIIAGMDISEKRIPQDGRIRITDGGRDLDLRVSTLPTILGEKAVLRLLDKSRSITTLGGLGFSAEMMRRYRQLIQKPYGMILATGPTGSGKTTTLVATLHALNQPGVNIITIEDPVEYQVPGANQVSINPRAGLTFASGLRAMLRQDPNIILVGEIRDAETAQISTRAALTGHLVLSSMHTNDAAGALTRLVDMEVEPFLVASSVIGAVAQRLVRVLCSNCKEPYELPSEAPERFLHDLPAGAFRLYRPRGCERCGRTGYRGRMAIFELLTVSREIRELVMARAATEEIREVAVSQGMRPLLRDGIDKALAGLTSLEEVRRVAFTEGS